jgi:pimeloyl-ACP methyl ester carboxylesterase
MTVHWSHIQVDGVNLHYKDFGPQRPGAPAVLLLHGFNGSVFNW